MDDFSMEGTALQEALDKIASINRLLGGNTLTLQGVQQLLKQPTEDTLTIVDVGCGNGDMLRTLANYANDNDLNWQLIGIDANAFTINYAKSLSVIYPNITYHCKDLFSEAFSQMNYDILLCTLTLHHFRNDQIATLLDVFHRQSRIGIVINDLHRSKLAYRLFQLVCFVFRLNPMSRQDGLTSILRGFKKEELEGFAKGITAEKQRIKWKWAFRYQWVVWKG
ncbi:methyltransferase domain-containing protein [Flavobacterium orientale]|nr:methyltransferase domain-containing protein [Flavobacterium orientale]